jgi:hypothetical protein
LLCRFSGLCDAHKSKLAHLPGATYDLPVGDYGMPGRATDLLVIKDSFWERSDVTEALGLAPKAQPASAGPDIPPRNTCPVLPAAAVSSRLSARASDSEEDEPPVRRRTFVGLTGASLASAILADPVSGGWADAIESFATVLVSRVPDTAPRALDDPDVPSLVAAVAQAKRDYQACRYSAVARSLPALISRSQAACAALDGQTRRQACTLSAEAHHVAASILLKAGDQGLG